MSDCSQILLSHPTTHLFSVIQVTSLSYLFVIGIMAYRLYQEPRSLLSYVVLSIAILYACSPHVSFSFAIRFPAPEVTAGGGHVSAVANGLLAAALAVVVWAAARLRLSGAVETILLFFGEISYSLYLVHQELGYFLLHLGSILGLPDDLSMLLVLIIVVAIARVINRLVERPAQRWIKNLYSARQEVAQVALAG